MVMFFKYLRILYESLPMLATIGARQQLAGAGRGIKPFRVVGIDRQMREVTFAEITGAGQAGPIMTLAFE